MPTPLPADWKNSRHRKAMAAVLREQHGQMVHTIIHQLRQAERILIGTHEHPDGDAVGSSLALLHALRLQRKQVTAYIPDPAPSYLMFLPGFSELTTERPRVADYDTVVLLDFTQLYRTGLADAVRHHPGVLGIDHHVSNTAEVGVNLIVPEAAATAQILTAFFELNDIPITRDMATCLLTGIFTDTGSFTHESTTPDVLTTASTLMAKGARLSHIAHETYQKKDLSGLRIWGRALARIVINSHTGAGVSFITYQDLQECGATLEDLSGVVNLLNTLPQTQFALLLAEYEPGKIKGSLRSEPHKGIDVSRIARRLGGGGHKLASGFEVMGHISQRDGQWRVVAA